MSIYSDFLCYYFYVIYSRETNFQFLSVCETISAACKINKVRKLFVSLFNKQTKKIIELYNSLQTKTKVDHVPNKNLVNQVPKNSSQRNAELGTHQGSKMSFATGQRAPGASPRAGGGRSPLQRIFDTGLADRQAGHV